MMKLTGTVSVGAGVLLVLPAWTQGDGTLQSLGQALSKTHAAIETFTGFLMQIESGDPSGVDAVRTFTEAPIKDERGRDEHSHELRIDINRLQMNLDYLEGLDTPQALVEPMSAPLVASQPSEQIHSALDAGMLETLGRVHAPSNAPTPDPVRTGPPPESENYSAAPLSHAQACYRAGQYEKCISLVLQLDETAETLFWHGRALERLDRTDEALATYEKAAGLDGPEGYPQRASDRLEFLAWKKDFMRTISTRSSTENGGQK